MEGTTKKWLESSITILIKVKYNLDNLTTISVEIRKVDRII